MPVARKRRVERYDGQLIWINGETHYDLGNYLGGGAAGVVYEGTNLKCSRDGAKSVAVKILNPVGFKLMSSGPLQRCILARKGQPLSSDATMSPANVWWCVHPTTRATIPAMPDARSGMLKELPLPKCIEIWGWDPLNEGRSSGSDDELYVSGAADGGRRDRGRSVNQSGYQVNSSDQYLSDEAAEKLARSGEAIIVDGLSGSIEIPKVPIKYIRWLRARQNIYKEIAHMAHLGAHPNVVGLKEVLEYIQDSKTTLFLVLEMVTGGELFDRIKIGKGTSERIAKQYFRQLVDGVSYCHSKGVCHRDLKPENLLLADSSDKAVLKIADFGLSAAFAIAAHGHAPLEAEEKPGSISMHHHLGGAPSTPVNIRRLRSVVGSPHYVAPEVTNEPVAGYDGPKADCWSAGVILYAILAGNLPFAKELSSCERYSKFKKWVSQHDVSFKDCRVRILPISCESSGTPSVDAPLDSLNWFFPKHFPHEARSLLVALLHPEPCLRPTMEQVSTHAWIATGGMHSESGVRSEECGERGAAAMNEDLSDQLALQVSELSIGSNGDVARALQQSFDDLIARREPPPPPL